jgi:hypothetical protein
LRRYLAQPVTIFLGNSDIGEHDDDLNTGPDAMAQGKTRLERAPNTFTSAKKLAAAHGWAFNWRLVRVPGVGHSARTMFSSPQALARISHTNRRIGSPNQRKLLCHNDFT